jgi:hypothetical protein
MNTSSREHYSEAWKIYLGFVKEHFADALQAHHERNEGSYVSVDELHVAPENLKKPQSAHFVLYTDVLGFSQGVSQGHDALPDFYGWALYGAHSHPEIRIFVLSDTCLAVSSSKHSDSLFTFASEYSDSLQGEGIVHQTYIGFGSFVERKPRFSIAPKNFLGTQVVGTAIVNAVELAKAQPLGSRILVSARALSKASLAVQESILCLANGEREYLPQRAPQFDMFDCIYYCLCLRDYAQGSRVRDHYVWSIASRTARLGSELAGIAVGLVAQSDPAFRSEEILSAVNEVLAQYQDAGNERKRPG